MAKSNRLLLLAGVYTALLAVSGGIEYRIGFFVVAAATTASGGANNPKLATCGAGSDQPHCEDLAYEQNDKDGGEAAARRTVTTTSRQATNKQTKNTAPLSRDASKDRAFCTSNDCSGGVGGTRPKFQPGDIIELYNTESRDIQIVFPSIVKGRDPSDPTGGYRVTKTTDGKEVKDLPEKFLHMYVPYTHGDEALCNIGEFRANRPIIVRCTVKSYEPAASRGAMVLQGSYEVMVHATKANEEYETNLPVWKLQRRYSSTGKGVTATA